MMYSLINGRNTRNKTEMYSPMHNPFANYCTESLQKSEMKLDYENEIFLNNLHLIPDPLMKNLADTLITSETPEKVKKQSLNTPVMPTKQPSKEDIRADSTLAGITNFFSGVFNMLSGAMFRTRSQVDYYDCFDAESRQGSPPTWLGANDVQDKNGQVPDKLSSDEPNTNGVKSDMNKCKTVGSCEQKLNQVKCLLSSASNKSSNSIWLRKRPRKVFVEPGSVEDSFEDAFDPEDFVPISNDPYVEYYSPSQYHTEELCETEAPKPIIHVAPNETTETVTVIDSESNSQKHKCDLKPEKYTIILDSNKLSNNTEESGDDKHQLVSSCEDKLSKLKALLKEKRTTHTKVIDPSPEPITEQPRPKAIPISKPVDKHYKNPHRMLDKRQKMKMKHSIQDDVIFANEIDLESPADSPSTPSTINSSETSLGDYFDEMKGRFRSISTTESEDSFQIVFNDTPKRSRKASDCESEDSFIVFEDNDSCYTSNDVFGDSDSESDVSDSGCSTMTCKLSHSLSRTVSNLTDDTLYESSDEVDCARVEPKVEARGLLMDADRKSMRKDQPAKKVHFSTEPPSVKVMRVWTFAARQARAGHWERYALDRDRFKRRIADVDMAVSWVLKPQHRSRVMFQRFMPLWNRQKREEIAEKKVKQAEEKRIEAERQEEQRIEEVRQEEERQAREEENAHDNTQNGSANDNISEIEVKENGVTVDTKTISNNIVKKDDESSNKNSDFKNENINKAMENLRIYNDKKNHKKAERIERNNNKVGCNVKNSKTLNTKGDFTEIAEIKNVSSKLVKPVNVLNTVNDT